MLAVSVIYLAVLGVGFMFAPRQIGIDAVPADASPPLIAYLRIFGGPCLGIAVLSWLARNAEPSAARNAIVLGNIVGFGCVTSMDVRGVFSGGARPVAKLFLVIHLLMTVAFVVAGRASMRAQREKKLRANRRLKQLQLDERAVCKTQSLDASPVGLSGHVAVKSARTPSLGKSTKIS